MTTTRDRRHLPHLGGALVVLASLVVGFTVEAQVVRQLTDIRVDVPPVIAAMDDAGISVYGASTTNQFGGNPDRTWQLFRWNATAPGGAQLTNLDGSMQTPAVSDDGNWLAFASTADPLGSNPDRSAELFVMRGDGTNLAQLTNDSSAAPGWVYLPYISGDGSRIVFGANGDLLGSNPQKVPQLFVINRDGTGLRQLTQGTVSSYPVLSGWRISDNGLRVVFESGNNLTGANPDLSKEIYAINADGTGLRQLTTSLATSEQPVISGDGSTISFLSSGDLVLGQNPFGVSAVFTMNWDGTALRQVTGIFTMADYVSIVDDGSVVYFCSAWAASGNSDGSSEVFRVAKNGTGLTQITNLTNGTELMLAEVSGSGNRLAVYSLGSPAPWGSGRFDDPQLHAMASTGGSPRQLTTALIPEIRNADLDSAGVNAYFGSDENLGGLNPTRAPQLWKLGLAGATPTRLVAMNDIPSQVSVSGTGEMLAFVAAPNPQSSDPAQRSTQLYSVSGNGTGLRQLTSAGSDSFAPAIARNGSVISFLSWADLNGSEGTGFSPDLFVILPNGTGLRRLTTAGSNSAFDVVGEASIDWTGEWVVFSSRLNLTGQNADASSELFRVRSNGTSMQQLTSAPAGGDSFEPDVSGDSRWVLFHSTADFLGSNPEHNEEVYLLDTTNSAIRQLTAYPVGTAQYTRISENGQWGFFTSTAPIFEPGPNRPRDGYRVRISDGWIQRMGGLSLYGDGAFSFMDFTPGSSDDGQKVSMVSGGNAAGQNPDRNTELYLVDFTQAPALNVSRTSPTLFSFTPEPSPIHYDVARGFVASLGPGAGDTVDLGPVSCLENDSLDPTIIGHEDPVSPAPGQAFFYLYRGSQGAIDGPGTWGRSTSGAERVAGSGSCLP